MELLSRKSVSTLFRLFCISSCLSFSFCRLGPQEVSATDSSPSHDLSLQDSVTVPADVTKSYRIRSGDTFAGILSNHDLPTNNAHIFHRLLKKTGFTSLFPGDSLVMMVSPEGGLHSFSLLSRKKQWFNVTFDSSRIRAEAAEVPVTSTLRVARGTLESSLAEALYAMGIGDAIVCRFTDIFAWDINFFIDPRPGDQFTIIFEERFASGRHAGFGEILAARYTTKDRVFYALGMTDSTGRFSYFDLEGKSVQKFFLKAPLRFSRISSGFSYRRKHPILGIVRPHLGIDYAAPTGTPVYAAADGKVIFAGRKGGYGKLVHIAHGGAYETMYGHLHGFARGIGKGKRVRQGDFIGTVGSTGLSTGPHLDYRMKKGKVFVNPRTVSVPAGEVVAETLRSHFDAQKAEYLSIIDHRFGRRAGAFTLDVHKPYAAKPVIAIEELATYVATTGN